MKPPFLLSLFSQQASPRAWLLAQNIIGGTPDKQHILKSHYQGQRHVIEIGCSVGNVARKLINEKTIEYLGIDIDESAITFAKRWFKNFPQFKFSTQSLQDLIANERKFDLICLTGVLHHVDLKTAEAMFAAARSIASEGAKLLIFDPLPLRQKDGLIYKIFHGLEQGEYLREHETILSMTRSAGFEVILSEEIAIGPGLIPWPKIMSLGVIVGQLN